MWKFCLASNTVIMILQIVIIFKENTKGWDIFEGIMLVVYLTVLLTIALVGCRDD